MNEKFTNVFFFMWLKLKKSGKEPKVGAEVLHKNVSQKTKVGWLWASRVGSQPVMLLSDVFSSSLTPLKKSHFFPPKVCERSTSPRWEEAFHYLVRDPRDESLTVKVSASVWQRHSPPSRHCGRSTKSRQRSTALDALQN